MNQKEIKIERGIGEYKKFGKITKLTFPDNSKIYITKKGWTLVLDEKKFKEHLVKAKKWGKIEMQLPYSEINVAIQESIFAGYEA